MKLTKQKKVPPSTEKLTQQNLKNLFEFCRKRYNKNGKSNWLSWEVTPISSRMRTEYLSAEGETLKVVGHHRGTKQRVVEFPDGTKVNATLDSLRRGRVVHPFAKTVAEIGYLGVGDVYSLAGAQRWQNIIKFSRVEGHKPVAEEWHCRATFLEWFVPKHEKAQKLYPGVQFDLESDFWSFLNGVEPIYSPSSTFLVPQEVNLGLQSLRTLSKTVAEILEGERSRLPRGLSLDSVADRLIVTCDGIRWGSFKHDPEGLLQGLELLSRLRVHKVLLQMESFNDVLDPLLPLMVQSLHEKLFGQLQLKT